MARANSAALVTHTRGRGPMTRYTAAERLPHETEAYTSGSFSKVVGTSSVSGSCVEYREWVLEAQGSNATEH